MKFPKLQKNERILQDLKLFQEKVTNIENPIVRKKYQAKLNEFIKQCDVIDQAHDSYNYGKVNPKAVRDNILELNRLRYELQNLK